MRIITLTTAKMLPQAKVLARSVQQRAGGCEHELLVVGSPGQGDAEAGPARVRPLAEVLEDADAGAIDVKDAIVRHDERDLLTLLLPLALRAYARSSGDPVLHLPPSAWVLGSLEPVARSLRGRGLLLFPRAHTDVPEDGLLPSRAQLEEMGRVSDTVIGVCGSGTAEAFLDWWLAQVEATVGALNGLEHGARPEDRHWLVRLLELAPARFAADVEMDPGCNLSLWNLHERELRAGADGPVVAGDGPVRFLDLPGFDPERPYRLSAHASRVRVSRSEALRELCSQYARELEGAGWHAANTRREVGRAMPGGAVYDDALDALHSRAEALGEGVGDPFSEEGAKAFMRWLLGPAPRGAAHGVNRYVYYRVLRERPDVMRAYPDLDGPDGAGYIAWCRAFGPSEMDMPEQFVPAADEHAAQSDAEVGSGRRNGSDAPAAGSDDGAMQGLADETTPVPSGDGSELAVRVTGFLSHTLGLGAAARGYARALMAAGVPTTTESVPLHHLELPVALARGYGLHGFEDVAHGGSHGFEIVAVNPDELPGFVERMGADYFRGPRIGVWGWETNLIPSRWRSAFELVDEIWVYSRFMAENFAAVAGVPVLALPPPVEVPPVAPQPLRLGVADDAFLFLFVFDYMSTIQRKNPVGAIEAFKQAFAPGEGPHLLVKTINAPLRPLAEEEVLWAAHGRADVHVVDCSLSGEERDALMAGCDCYVSLHRSEGFGLTLAEAMALGKPVIGTGYSGNVDFMSPSNSYLVDYRIVRVGPDCEIYPPEGEWAEPSIDHAAELMRGVYERPQEAAAIGERAREEIATRLSALVTGTAMRARLEELQRAARSGTQPASRSQAPASASRA